MKKEIMLLICLVSIIGLTGCTEQEHEPNVTKKGTLLEVTVDSDSSHIRLQGMYTEMDFGFPHAYPVLETLTIGEYYYFDMYIKAIYQVVDNELIRIRNYQNETVWTSTI